MISSHRQPRRFLNWLIPISLRPLCAKPIKLDPHNPRPHHNLAIILRAQGKTKDADAQERMAEHPD